MHRDHKELEKQASAHAENLANLEGRQQAMQADVDRLREREEVQARIADLKDAQIMAAYNKSRARHAEVSERLNQAKQLQKELQNECAPSLEATNKKARYCEAVTAAVRARQVVLRDAEEAANHLLNKVDDASDRVAQVTTQINAESEGFSTKKKELRIVNQKIGQLENKLKNRPPDFDPKEHNQKIVSAPGRTPSFSFFNALTARPVACARTSTTRSRERSPRDTGPVKRRTPAWFSGQRGAKTDIPGTPGP